MIEGLKFDFGISLQTNCEEIKEPQYTKLHSPNRRSAHAGDKDLRFQPRDFDNWT